MASSEKPPCIPGEVFRCFTAIGARAACLWSIGLTKDQRHALFAAAESGFIDGADMPLGLTNPTRHGLVRTFQMAYIKAAAAYNSKKGTVSRRGKEGHFPLLSYHITKFAKMQGASCGRDAIKTLKKIVKLTRAPATSPQKAPASVAPPATDAMVHPQSSQLEIGEDELKYESDLSTGAFGKVDVYKWGGTAVVLKSFVSPPGESPHHARSRFMAEAVLHSELRHPGISMFLGVCSRLNAMVIKLENRGTLYNALRRESTRWPPECIWKVAYGVASAMRYLHTRRPPVMHRDIKSDNIFLDANFDPVIGDFGHAARVTPAITFSEKSGTLDYMAPEVIMQQPYSLAIDCYSFGTICRELLTREDPYEGMSELEIEYAVTVHHIRPALPHGCPDGFADIITRCWSPQPADRPTFEQVVHALVALPWAPANGASQLIL